MLSGWGFLGAIKIGYCAVVPLKSQRIVIPVNGHGQCVTDEKTIERATAARFIPIGVAGGLFDDFNVSGVSSNNVLLYALRKFLLCCVLMLFKASRGHKELASCLVLSRTYFLRWTSLSAM